MSAGRFGRWSHGGEGLVLPVVLSGCLSACSASDLDTPSPPPSEVVVLTSNFQVGGVVGLSEPVSDSSALPDIVPGQSVLHSDASLRVFEDRVYVINRLGADNIQVLDPTQGFQTIQQFSVGAGSNPQDIALVSPERAYVTLYNSASLLIVNPTSGQTLGTVDLSAYAEGDPDGFPELSSLLAVGDQLFVTAQRLERTSSGFIPLGDSKLIRVDLTRDEADGAITLAMANPFGQLMLEPDGKHVLLPCPGTFGALDGGLERIDLTLFQSDNILVTEYALQADIVSALALSDDARELLLIVSQATGGGEDSDGSTNTHLVKVQVDSLGSEGVLDMQTILSPDGYVLWDLVRGASGRLFVTDRTLTAPGVWMFADATLSSPAFIPFSGDVLPPTSGAAL